MKKLFFIVFIVALITSNTCMAYNVVEMERGAEYDEINNASSYYVESLSEIHQDKNRDIYVDGVLKVPYDSDTLISWGLSTQLSQLPQTTAEERAILGTAIVAFVDFANKVNTKSRDNFLAIAQSIGMVDLANTIIAKAIELGADIE